MWHRIRKHVFDLLQADTKLIQGGASYAAGWTGVKRIRAGDTPTVNYVNLYDTPYREGVGSARPAIYAGTIGNAITDTLEYPTVSAASVFTEFRKCKIPLIIAAQSPKMHDAMDQCEQLVANVHSILLGHIGAETGYWYMAQVEGDRGGGDARIIARISSTGQGEVGVSEEQVVFPLVVHYTMNASSPA